MARVAVHTVVHVAVSVRMVKVSGIVIAMARRAREYRVICGVRVARRAYPIRIPVIDREESVIRRR